VIYLGHCTVTVPQRVPDQVVESILASHPARSHSRRKKIIDALRESTACSGGIARNAREIIEAEVAGLCQGCYREPCICLPDDCNCDPN